MKTNKPSFGVGFDSLMDSCLADKQDKKEFFNQYNVENIDTFKITPSVYQARKEFDEKSLTELGESIKKYGIIQPIVLRKIADGEYELIAGERRWRSASMVGLGRIPAIVLDITDEESMAIGLIENIQRENLNILEEAQAYSRLIYDFKLTHEKIADKVGKSRSFITNCLRVLSLPDQVKQQLIDGKITFGHAKVLLAAPQEHQTELSNMVVKGGLSVRDLEKLLSKCDEQEELKGLENQIYDAIRLRVEIKPGAKQRYQITVSSKRELLQLVDALVR